MSSLFILLMLNLAEEIKIISLREAPIIDGHIEDSWNSINPIYTANQWFPNEEKDATETTRVYIGYNEEGIFIVFQCFDSEPEKVDIRVVPRDCFENGDNVWVMLDTYCNGITAYELGVNAAGVQLDDILTDDGRKTDVSWDGIWYSAVKITDYGYNVEMKIPFKTLHYDPKKTEWRVNFFRYISRKNETDCWAPIKQSEGIRVSRCGILKGIHPGRQGLHLEIHPVALGRVENDAIGPEIGLDIKWGITSSTRLVLTACPGFAQIEADPYTINLSKYETYLDERRPFFIEGRKVFGTPTKLFYSRRIGKRLYSGEKVPVIGGAKYTGTSGKLNYGFLSAYTDEMGDEPKSLYSVGRASLSILENSEIGLMYSEVRDSEDKQGVGGVDFTYRTTELQLQSQIAKEKGYAELIKLDWYAPRFCILGKYEHFDEDFNIDRVGYAPWKGRTQYYLSAGPRFFNIGPFYALTTGVGGGRRKEINESVWGHWAEGWLSSTFRNNWGCYYYLTMGRSWEMDRWYDYYQTSLSHWTDNSKPVVLSDDFWYTSCGFNYRRGYFAEMGTNDFYLDIRPSPSLTLSFNLSTTLEWGEEGEFYKTSWVARPIMQYALTKDIHLRIYTEPNTDTHIHQLNVLLSYNFRPKSWFYLAFNETRDNTEGNMSLKDRIIVAKFRYLFFI